MTEFGWFSFASTKQLKNQQIWVICDVMTGDWSKLASIKFGRLKSTTFGWFLQMHRFTTNLVDLNPPLLGYFFACIDLPQTWEFKSCKFQPILGDLNCQFWMICSHASLNQIRWFLCMHRLSPFLGDLKLHVKDKLYSKNDHACIMSAIAILYTLS